MVVMLWLIHFICLMVQFLIVMKDLNDLATGSYPHRILPLVMKIIKPTLEVFYHFKAKTLK